MGTKYEKGRGFEAYIIKKLREAGYYTTRSAGSKGVFDVVAIKNGVVWGVQCKASQYVPKKEIDTIVETGRKYGIIPCLAKKDGRRTVVICLYTGKEVV